MVAMIENTHRMVPNVRTLPSHLSRGGREGRRAGASSTIRHRLFDVGVVLHGFHDCCHASTTLVRATNGEDGGEEDDKDDEDARPRDAADAWARAWRERYVNRRAVRLVDGLDDVCGGVQIHVVWWCDVHGDLS